MSIHTIPNYNRNTGKTATLFEIFCSHINTLREEELGNGIDRALAVVEGVKVARIAATTGPTDGLNRTEHADPNINHSFESENEAEALAKPLLYALEQIESDEARISELVEDLKSIESAEQTIESLKRLTSLDVDFIVPQPGTAIRFAVLQRDSSNLNFAGNEPVVVPIIHYTNADARTGKYFKDANGLFPDIEWEVGFLYLTPRDLLAIQRQADEQQSPYDIDLVLEWSPRSITMKHGGPTGPLHHISRATNKARWKKDIATVAEVSKALAVNGII